MAGQIWYLTFDERLQLCIDSLYQRKYSNRESGLIKPSKFRIQDADAASVHYEKWNMDRLILQEFATRSHIKYRKKYHLPRFYRIRINIPGSALRKAVCKQEIRTRYIRLPDLLNERDEGMLKPKRVTSLITKFADYGSAHPR